VDCIEIWADNFKGCPRCIEHEKNERKKRGIPLPEVKKQGKGKKEPDEVDILIDDQNVQNNTIVNKIIDQELKGFSTIHIFIHCFCFS
jgi:hypothetical protein